MTRIIAQIFRDRGATAIFTIRNNLQKLEFDSLDRGNIGELVNWGIVSNRGQISFYDYGNKFADIYNQYEADNKFRIKFFLVNENDYLSVKFKQIGTFYISKARYDRFFKKIDLELTDGFEEWQDKYIDLDFSHYMGTTQTLYTIYNDIRSIVSNLFGITLNLGIGVKALFESITIPNPYRVETVSVWSIINEICAMSMCRVVSDEFGDACITMPLGNSNVKEILANQILNINLVENAHNNAIKRVSVSVQKVISKKVSVVGKQKIEIMSSYLDAAQNEDAPFTVTLSDPIEYEGNFSPDQAYKKNALISTTSPIPMETVGNILRWENIEGTAVHISREGSGNDIEEEKSFKWQVNESQTKQYGDQVSLAFNIDQVTLYGYFLAGEANAYKYYKSIDVDFYAMMDFVDGTEDYTAGNNKENTVKLFASSWLKSDNKKGDENHGLWLVNTALRTYAEGAECLETTCNIAEESQSFSRYDVIIPYVMTPEGQVPYSTNSDGTAKKFLVAGYKYSDDGHPTQKLYLQEYKN